MTTATPPRSHRTPRPALLPATANVSPVPLAVRQPTPPTAPPRPTAPSRSASTQELNRQLLIQKLPALLSDWADSCGRRIFDLVMQRIAHLERQTLNPEAMQEQAIRTALERPAETTPTFPGKTTKAKPIIEPHRIVLSPVPAAATKVIAKSPGSLWNRPQNYPENSTPFSPGKSPSHPATDSKDSTTCTGNVSSAVLGTSCSAADPGFPREIRQWFAIQVSPTRQLDTQTLVQLPLYAADGRPYHNLTDYPVKYRATFPLVYFHGTAMKVHDAIQRANDMINWGSTTQQIIQALRLLRFSVLQAIDKTKTTIPSECPLFAITEPQPKATKPIRSRRHTKGPQSRQSIADIVSRREELAKRGIINTPDFELSPVQPHEVIHFTANNIFEPVDAITFQSKPIVHDTNHIEGGGVELLPGAGDTPEQRLVRLLQAKKVLQVATAKVVLGVTRPHAKFKQCEVIG